MVLLRDRPSQGEVDPGNRVFMGVHPINTHPPVSGIYRCTACHEEEVHTAANNMPPCASCHKNTDYVLVAVPKHLRNKALKVTRTLTAEYGDSVPGGKPFFPKV